MVKATLMLVEDDRSTLMLLQTLLELEGFRVLVSENLSDIDTLLAGIRADKPDLLLVDVHLRKYSGLDLVKQLRQGGESGSTRVLMTSGMEMNEECFQAGADAFLLKPFVPDDLVGRINELLTPSRG